MADLVMPVVHNADPLNKVDPLPSEVPNRLYGDQNHPSLFSLVADDIISMVASGGSTLMRWLPSRGVNWWNEPVAHLSWIAPDGFTGEDSYSEWLAAQEEVAECDFGDGTTYNICEYNHTMSRMSFSTRNEPIKIENLGMKQFESSPIRTLRDPKGNQAISNDRDWSLARLASVMEEHMNWTQWHGNAEALPNTTDGLGTILTTGWVKQHKFGKGSCDFTDPMVVSAVGENTPEAILRKLRAIIRHLRNRMSDRNYTPRGDDMVVALHPMMWQLLADQIAFGTMVSWGKPEAITMNINALDVSRERASIMQGGLGEGNLYVDGIPVPIVTDTRLGAGSNLGDVGAMTGDIFVLTKRFRNLTILEHQYLDWSKLGKSPFDTPFGNTGEYKPTFFQNNMVRVQPVPLNGNHNCWFYGAEMYGRMVTYMQPLQARIMDVTLPIEAYDNVESVSFAMPNFYAYDGAVGGEGTAILTGLI